jgi:hypothetical protein
MGRPRHSQPPVDPAFVAERLAVRQDGEIVRRDGRIAALMGEPATFTGPKGERMVRVTYNRRTRRIGALRGRRAPTPGV